jgi:hypothetical protein
LTDLGPVPQDLVSAGTPADSNEWTEEQKMEFFKQAPVQEPATGEQDSLEVAEIEHGADGEAIA